MPWTDWRALAPVYDYWLSSASLIATQIPFNVGSIDLYAERHRPLHWHDAFEIGYVLEGEGLFVIEDQDYPFRPGQVHVINNSQRHMAYAVDHARFFNVHFHPDLLSDSTFPALAEAACRPFTVGSQRFAPLLPADNPRTKEVIVLLHALADEHHAAAPQWPLAAKGLILQVLALLLRYFVAPDPPDPTVLRRQELARRLAPALRLLEQRLVAPPGRAELARAVALSPSRFNALFRSAMGVSPVVYRNTRRIAQAQRLLADSDATIAMLAEQCGFATVQQFNRVFRQVSGCTPGTYRDRARGRSRP